jgi:hypothetical protein
MNYLKENDLLNQVPSIFSMQAHEKTSEKYALIPTIECIRGLEKAGFYPVSVQQSNCRNKENKPFSKHLIRFRREGMLEMSGNIPEIVMINSHNGACSYQLRAGIYRVVCTNGLIVGNDLFYHSIRHQGNVVSKVVESANQIIEVIPQVLEIAEEWKGITLNTEQKKVFADSAALLKWEKDESDIETERLLRPRRYQDNQNDLWTTFNTVQENIIRGGVRYYDRETRRRGTTREVKSVSENSRLNTALWNLTEKMASLAK